MGITSYERTVTLLRNICLLHSIIAIAIVIVHHQMKLFLSLFVLASSAWSFVPTGVHIRPSFSLDAKHVQKKATKKANRNRPRKSRPSDINRKPTNYNLLYHLPNTPLSKTKKTEVVCFVLRK